MFFLKNSFRPSALVWILPAVLKSGYRSCQHDGGGIPILLGQAMVAPLSVIGLQGAGYMFHMVTTSIVLPNAGYR